MGLRGGGTLSFDSFNLSKLFKNGARRKNFNLLVLFKWKLINFSKFFGEISLYKGCGDIDRGRQRKF